jgi:hypothetical protein
MRPVRVVVAAVAVSSVIPIDQYLGPTNIGLGVVITTGPATYTVEHTFDNIWDPLVTPVWFPHPTLVAQTTNKDSNYAAPPRAVRLNVTAFTAGSVALTLVQAGAVG